MAKSRQKGGEPNAAKSGQMWPRFPVTPSPNHARSRPATSSHFKIEHTQNKRGESRPVGGALRHGAAARKQRRPATAGVRLRRHGTRCKCGAGARPTQTSLPVLVILCIHTNATGVCVCAHTHIHPCEKNILRVHMMMDTCRISFQFGTSFDLESSLLFADCIAAGEEDFSPEFF